MDAPPIKQKIKKIVYQSFFGHNFKLDSFIRSAYPKLLVRNLIFEGITYILSIKASFKNCSELICTLLFLNCFCPFSR